MMLTGRYFSEEARRWRRIRCAAWTLTPRLRRPAPSSDRGGVFSFCDFGGKAKIDADPERYRPATK